MPVFDYMQVLVVNRQHPLAEKKYLVPEQLAGEVLFSYPVPMDRLDIYNRFLMPAGIMPKRHKTIETTDIMLQMVASGRGLAALPRWLLKEYASRLPVVAVRLGKEGIDKQILLGAREADVDIDYLRAFVDLARRASQAQ